MSHADAMLAFLTRPAAPVCEDARIVYQRRRIAAMAADLDTVTLAARALLSELYPALPVLPAAWEDLADVVGWQAPEGKRPKRKSGRIDPEIRAELIASGLACMPMAQGGGYIVASATEPGRVYAVHTDAGEWQAWRCACQGGAHVCKHKRRARQEARREARAKDRPAQWSQRVTHNRAPR